MTEPEAPKIEFPCDYPIKVMGRATPDYKEFVVDTMSKHAVIVEHETINVRESRNGKFISVTVTITATGKEQLETIHQAFINSGRVQMVL